MLIRPHAQGGITLLELMVGSSLGLLLLSALLAFYGHNIQSSGEGLRMAHLHQQMHAVLAIMTRDIRRAGYYGVPPRTDTLALLAANPFTDADDPAKPADRRNDLRVGAYARNRRAEAPHSCILYSYDLNGDGQVQESGTGMERFGFRLREETVQMRYGGRDFTCSDGSWRAVNDDSIRVTQLQFTLQESHIPTVPDSTRCTAGQACLIQRAVQITLAAQLRHAPSVRVQLQQTLRMRNHKLLSALPAS